MSYIDLGYTTARQILATLDFFSGHRFTLVDNKYGEQNCFLTARDVIGYLLDEKAKEWKDYCFYSQNDVAPSFCNRLDASDHVKSWSVHTENAFDSQHMVFIKYTADKQMLFQTTEGAEFRE